MPDLVALFSGSLQIESLLLCYHTSYPLLSQEIGGSLENLPFQA